MKKILLILFIANFVFAQGEILWQKSKHELPGDGYTWSTPLVIDGKLVWAGQDKSITTFNAHTGEIIWVDSVNFSSGSYDSPVGYEGKAFLSNKNYNDDTKKGFYALNVEDGSVVWKVDMLNYNDRCFKPISIANNTIHLAGQDTLYALDIDDGSIKWQMPGKYKSLLIDNDDTRLFAGRSDTAIVEVISLTDGSLLWDYLIPNGENIAGSMAFKKVGEEEYLIIMPGTNWNNDEPTVYCLDVDQQSLLWSSTEIGYVGNGAGPSIYKDKVFAGTQKSSSDTVQSIVSFNLLNGTINWEKSARWGGATNTPYVIALGDKIFFENILGDYQFTCADYQSGDTLWTAKPESEYTPISWGSPVFYGNKVYLPTDGEGLYCFLTAETTGEWRMVNGNIFGTGSFVEGLVTDIKTENPSVIKDYRLNQNYPNPFNPSTTISFNIALKGFYSLKVYNSIGEEIATLINKELNAGTHKVNFNAAELSSGVYFYKLKGNEINLTKKMILMK